MLVFSEEEWDSEENYYNDGCPDTKASRYEFGQVNHWDHVFYKDDAKIEEVRRAR